MEQLSADGTELASDPVMATDPNRSALVDKWRWGQTSPPVPVLQASLRETGIPRLVMRLITLPAIWASPFSAGRVRARRLLPIKTLYTQTVRKPEKIE